MSIKIEDIELQLSGKLLITDPAYLFSREDWSEIYDKISGTYFGVALILDKDKQIYISHTAFGNGRYPVEDVTVEEPVGYFDVNSGFVAIIPLDIAEELAKKSDKVTLLELVERRDATIVYVSEPDTVVAFGDGKIRVGQFVIDTSDEEDSQRVIAEDVIFINGREVLFDDEHLTELEDENTPLPFDGSEFIK